MTNTQRLLSEINEETVSGFDYDDCLTDLKLMYQTKLLKKHSLSQDEAGLYFANESY